MPIDPQTAAGIAESIQNIGNIYATEGMNKRQRKWASSEAEKSYARSIEAWNMANEYNSPKAQMQRLSEAGLNPNLIYGNISNTPAASTAPSYKAAEFKQNTAKSELNPYILFDLKLKQAQLDQMYAQTGKIEAETSLIDPRKRLIESQITGLEIRNTFEPLLKGLDVKIKDQLLSKTTEEIMRIQASTSLITTQEKLAEFQNYWNFQKAMYWDKYRINIDKDGTIERKATLFLDKAVETWKEWQKNRPKIDWFSPENVQYDSTYSPN